MLKDMFGRLLVAGQTVVYPNRHENDLWLVQAQVIAVDPNGKGDIMVRAKNARRNSRVSALRRVAIIDAPHGLVRADVQPHTLRTAGEMPAEISHSREERPDSLTPGTRLDV